MKICIFGKGQLGSYLYDALKDDYEVKILSHKDCDIKKDFEIIEQLINESDLIINCAAYTNVDGAEDNVIDSLEINAFGPIELLKRIKLTNKKFVHISSETVYGSNNVNYNPILETENKTPTCVYSIHKKMADDYIEDIINRGDVFNCKILLLRPGWLFGPNSNKNFISKIIKLLNSSNSIKVVTDQIGSLTSVELIKEAIISFINDKLNSGVYNIANDGYASRYDVANYINELIKSNCIIEKCTSFDYERKACIAKNSCLDCSKIKNSCNFQFENWKIPVKKLIYKIMDFKD